MNTMHLAYAVEVERCGSITQAAENLYMAQPNLSKAIKELEDAMGFSIFSRTSRGVVPTERGREFLTCAKAILAELRKMEALNGGSDDRVQRVSLSVASCGYMLDCLCRLLDTLDRKEMDENKGMLFIFTNEDWRSFWMHNTLIPLDIIYVNAKREVVSICKNTNTLDDTSLPSEAPAMYVIEINAGLCDKYGIDKGTKVNF